MSDELRQDIAGAIYDATGLRGEAWATASDVADEYVLADAVLAVVQPLVDERDRLKDEAVHYIAQRLALDEVAKHADALRVERDRLLWLHAEAVWQREQLRIEADHQWTVRRQMGHRLIDLDSELTEAVDLARWLLAESAWRLAKSEDSRFPADWRQQIGLCESSGAAVDLVESWLGTVEAAPPHGPDAAPAVIPTFEMVAWCEIHDADARSCACPEGAYEERHRDCATAGGVCIERHVGVSGTGTEASKAAAAPSPDVDRETLVEVLSRDHAEINALWDEDPDDYWRTLADRLIAAGYVCTPGHEWQCPGCGATTRARMADYPTEAEHVCPAVRAVVVDREALLDVLKLADADYSHGYRTTAYLTHIADALLARYDIRERGETA